MKKTITLLALSCLVCGTTAYADDKAKAKATKAPALMIEDAQKFIDQYDTNKDGFIQRDELPADWRDRFDELDLNKDSKLSKSELTAHAEKMRHTAENARELHPVDMIVGLIEAGKDTVDLSALQHAYDVLRLLDRKNDGKLTIDDLAVARQRIRELRVNRLMTMCDTNKDGKLSKDETHGWLKAHFDEIDANKDGFLDNAELQSAPRLTRLHDGDHQRAERGRRPNANKTNEKE